MAKPAPDTSQDCAASNETVDTPTLRAESGTSTIETSDEQEGEGAAEVEKTMEADCELGDEKGQGGHETES